MKRFFSHMSLNFLFLFLALFSGVFSVSGTFSLTDESGFLLLLVLFSALGCALLRSASSLRFRGLLFLAVLVVLCILLWRQFDQVLLGARMVFHKISYTYHQLVPSIPFYIAPEGITPLQTSAGIRWFFGLAVPFLALWMGLYLTPARRTLWPILLLSAVFPAIGLVVLLEPPLLPMLALVFLAALCLLTGRGFRVNASLGLRRVWAAVVPIGIVLALVLAIVPPTRYIRPQKVDFWRTSITSWFQEFGLAFQGGGVGISAFASQNFSNAGPLEFDGHTVLTVEGAAKGRLLLRGFTAGVYGKSSWQLLDPDAYGSLLAPPEDSYPFTLPAQGASNDLPPVTATIRLQIHPTSGFLYTPYQLLDLPSGVPADSFHEDSYLARAPYAQSWQVSYYPELSPEDVSLVVRSARWEMSYRGWVAQNYMSVPARVPLDILRPAELQGIAVSTSQGRLEAAQRVTQYLAQTVRYDQQTPVTPEGEDFVTYFLTQSHQGYCLHYASAAVLMLRAMGIPTRFVSGYMANVPYDGAVIAVPDANAHAWVEIYLDGYGWYPVDVTSGFSGSMDTVIASSASPSPSMTPEATAAPTPSPPAPTPSAAPSPSSAPSKAPAVAPGAAGSSSSWLIPVLVLVSIGLALALILLQRRLRLAHWKRAMTQSDPNQAAIAVYRYLAALNRRGGVPIHPTIRVLGQKAAFSQHVLTQAELRTMLVLTQESAQTARTQTGLWRRLLLRCWWALI